MIYLKNELGMGVDLSADEAPQVLATLLRYPVTTISCLEGMQQKIATDLALDLRGIKDADLREQIKKSTEYFKAAPSAIPGEFYHLFYGFVVAHELGMENIKVTDITHTPMGTEIVFVQKQDDESNQIPLKPWPDTELSLKKEWEKSPPLEMHCRIENNEGIHAAIQVFSPKTITKKFDQDQFANILTGYFLKMTSHKTVEQQSQVEQLKPVDEKISSGRSL